MIIESLKALAVPIDSLRGLPNNPRKGDVSAVMASLSRFGQRKPIVVRRSDSIIIAGNHTWQAAKQLGWSEIAVAWTEDDEDTMKAYALADNRTAELGSYDDQLLKDLIDSVAQVDIDLLRDTGWSDQAVTDLLQKIEATTPSIVHEDNAPEIPEEAKVKLNQIWQLGDHLLYCGDSTKQSVFDALMGQEKAHIIWTDPPWNVNYGAIDQDNAQGYKVRTILNDNMSEAQWDEFVSSFCNRMFEFTLSGAPIYLVMSAQEWPVIDRNLRQAGFHWSSTIIWNKDRLVLSRKDYHTKYEPIWYGWNAKAPRLVEVADRKQSDVWDFERPSRSELHPTMKPIQLICKSLQNSSKPGNIVLDPFGGSGSTLMAAEQTNRKCRMIELDPRYCDVIIERWENFTGKKAVLVNNAESSEA